MKVRKSSRGNSYFVKGHWSLFLGEGTGWDGRPAVPQNQTITQNLLSNPRETFPRKCCPEASPSPWLLSPLGIHCRDNEVAEESLLALSLHPGK